MPLSAAASGGEPCVEQLAQRIVHLEADLALLTQRKQDLERENEVLAAAAGRQSELEAKLADAIAARDKLEEECRAHRAESTRRADMEQQQAALAASFTELQGVVSQLVRRLGELNGQRSRLAEEKKAAEAVAMKLRVELDRWRGRATGVDALAAIPPQPFAAPVALRVAAAAARAAVGAPGTVAGLEPLRPRCGPRTRCRAADASQIYGSRTTPPPRGAGGDRASPSGASAGAGGFAEPLAAANAAAAATELAEARLQCELLRDHLSSEELACEQARIGAEAMFSESSNAQLKTAELQSELREVLACWSARGTGEHNDDRGEASLQELASAHRSQRPP